MHTPDKQVKLAIVDDHNLFRKGLIRLINQGDKNKKYVILFEAENGADLKNKLTKKNTPDIILMDIDMPDIDGYEAVSWLKNYHPDIKILIITMFISQTSIDRMMQLSVHGYLSKDIEVDDMHKALEAISNNTNYYSNNVSEVITWQVSKEKSAADILDEKWKNLTENERKFIKYACTELTYKQIAQKMLLSPKTIDGYRESLFQKFNVKNRVGLAMLAVRCKWVKIDE
jgi:two-component system, NarL family, invasion response regulator UvrY